MNILIVSQYFYPENFRINDLAVGLCEMGHHVTVLTGIPNYPEGSFFTGYGVFRGWTENYGKVKILRVPLIPRGKGHRLQLVLNYLSFAFFACILGPLRCCCAYDLIFVCQLSPVTVCLPAIVMKKIKAAPMVIWVQDLWPESLSATGAVRSASILKIVELLVRFIYKHCDLILVQSQAFVDAITKMNVDSEKIQYFPNTAEDFFKTTSEPAEPANGPEFPDGFCVMFAGNVGAAQDFETILSAAERIRNKKDIHWLIVGDGRMLPWVQEQVQRRELEDTVHLLGRHPVKAMPGFFAKADAMLVTLRRESIFALTVPGKLQSYLACAKPIICALDGEGSRVVEEAGAGLTCPAESPEALVKSVMQMYAMTVEERDRMAKSGRDYFEKNFERQMLLDRLGVWLSELVRKGQ